MSSHHAGVGPLKTEHDRAGFCTCGGCVPEASITAVFVTSLTDVRPISVEECVKGACYDAMLRSRLALRDLNNTGEMAQPIILLILEIFFSCLRYARTVFAFPERRN